MRIICIIYICFVTAAIMLRAQESKEKNLLRDTDPLFDLMEMISQGNIPTEQLANILAATNYMDAFGVKAPASGYADRGLVELGSAQRIIALAAAARNYDRLNRVLATFYYGPALECENRNDRDLFTMAIKKFQAVIVRGYEATEIETSFDIEEITYGTNRFSAVVTATWVRGDDGYTSSFEFSRRFIDGHSIWILMDEKFLRHMTLQKATDKEDEDTNKPSINR